MSRHAQVIRLVVFDWAGTTVDYGCFAPVAAFIGAFARHGVAVTAEQARGPMGLHKSDHIRAMLQMPAVAAAWITAHGREWADADVEAIFREFMPMQLDVLDQHSRLIPGLLECVEELYRRGMKIGGTTGYFRAAADRVRAAAAAQGYAPEFSFCPEDVAAGRPAPWMIFRNMEAAGVFPPATVVKVGDTVPDIEEGRNAGVWSIGVSQTSSEVGCTEAEFAALSDEEKRQRVTGAELKLMDAGAHAVIPTVADLPNLLLELDARLLRGEHP